MNEAVAIDELLRRHVTFAAFRLPGQAALAYVQHGRELTQAQSEQRGFMLAPFEAADGSVFCIKPDTLLDLSADHVFIEDVGHARPYPTPDLLPGLDRAGYAEAVRTAIASIESGLLEKVVLARTLNVDLGGLSLGRLFSMAARNHPQAFIALVRTERFGLWIGASPERLLALHGDRVDVDALAATLPKGEAPSDPSAWKPKEREEQAMVTHSVLEILAAHGVQDLRAEGPRVIAAGNVMHLHSGITGRVTGSGALPLAYALHPTPAVGGIPRTSAINLLRTLEPRNRLLYGGYWGPVDGRNADFYVNIRCMEVGGGQALVHAGAGITAGSDPDRECDEVERKARTWLDLIDEQRRSG
ncbi:MAG: chorismate-binding protein [Flavobacteriales bacterium]|nr:chorismate-binding protein [Flavobacteriales bacterium]